jgi:hypothetical protein
MKLKMPISQNCISTIYTSDKYLWRGILDLINLKRPRVEANLLVLLLFICNGDPIITWGMVKVPLAGLTLPHFVPLPSQDLNFKVIYHGLFFVFKELKVRGDTFCWYLWNCWPSQFKLFKNSTDSVVATEIWEGAVVFVW